VLASTPSFASAPRSVDLAVDGCVGNRILCPEVLDLVDLVDVVVLVLVILTESYSSRSTTYSVVYY
jgi:hypothetical protein